MPGWDGGGGHTASIPRQHLCATLPCGTAWPHDTAGTTSEPSQADHRQVTGMRHFHYQTHHERPLQNIFILYQRCRSAAFVGGGAALPSPAIPLLGFLLLLLVCPQRDPELH